MTVPVVLLILGSLLILATTIIGLSTARMSERDIAREIAKAQLLTYNRLRKKRPQLKGESLYKTVLLCRLDMTEKRAEEIINLANILKQKRVPLSLRFITWALAISEFERIRPYPLTLERKIEMLDEIIKVIPDKI